MRLHLPSTAGAVAVSAALASAQTSFQPPVDHAVGSQPTATAIADLDEDGDLDLAVTSSAPDKVGILLNDGAGAFAPPIDVLLSAGSAPHTVAAGDLDGDGDVDLAVTLQALDAVQTIVNQAGAFTPGAIIAVGRLPGDLAIENVDNDGDLDVVCVDRLDHTVSVLVNQGGLAFAASAYPAGFGPRDLALGDLTGDGRIDIAIAARDANRVVVLRNEQAVGFVLETTLSLGTLSPDGLTLAWFDSDARLDVAASSGDGSNAFASVFLNLGGGAFAGPSNYALAGQNAVSIVAANLDGDHGLDLATANADTNDVASISNMGNGGFFGGQIHAVAERPVHVAAGDLDADGQFDLVTTNQVSNDVSVLFNARPGGACSVEPYCAGKVDSSGGIAALHASGIASFSSQDLVIAVSNALPTQTGVLFYGGTGPAAFSLFGGMVCVDTPLVRFDVEQTSTTGDAQFAIPVDASMIGETRWYQFFYRDPQHPDASGTGLSNALKVSFGD